MKFTKEEEMAFLNWQLLLVDWERGGRKWQLPHKPMNYDLWKQDEDQLDLLLTKHIRCQGGGLVPDTWIKQQVVKVSDSTQ